MMTKRIRCTCGRVYDPVKRPACPDCGAASPVATAPAPPPAPLEEETKAARARETKTSGSTPSPISPKYLAIGAAVLCLLLLVILVSRKGGHEKSAVVKQDAATPQARAIPSATPAATPAPSAPEVVRREVPMPTAVPSPPAEIPTPPPTKIPGEEYDLAALIANAAPGATIKVRPGTYTSLTLTRPVKLAGDPSAPVFIKGEGQSALTVKSPGVSLQNIQLLTNGIGALPAVAVAEGSALEMNAVGIQSTTEIGVLVTGKSSIKALGTTFAVPYGACVRLKDGATANLTQCAFSDSKTGLNAWSGATAELHSCAFERDGGSDGHGSIIALNGQGTSVMADDCYFNSNRAGAVVSQQATITVTNSTFQENAASVEDGILGLISVRNGGHARLESDRFESNHQGIAVIDGGSIEIRQCNLAGNGLWQGRKVIPESLPLLVSGQNSIADVRKTTFSNSAQHAIGVMAGGKLTLEEVDITGSRIAGVILGERNTAPVRAKILRSHLNQNGTGLGVLAGSKVEIEDSEFRENNDGIIVIDTGSQLKATRSALSANRNHGLSVSSQAEAKLVDCDLNQNARGAESGVHNKPAERASITLVNCRLGGNRVYAAGAAMQSELILTNCVFDGTDKMNINRERGAKIEQTNDNPEPSVTPASEAEPSPAAGDETSPAPEENVEPSASPSPQSSVSPSPAREKGTPRPRRKPTPRPHPPTPEDIRRALRRLLPGG